MIKNIKKLFFYIESKAPAAGKHLIKFLRWIRFYFYYKPQLLYYSLFKNERKDNKLFRTFWVYTNNIKYNFRFSDKKLHLTKDRGIVLDGDWDLSKSKFEDTVIYKSIRDRFILEKKWNKTDLYKEGIDRINKGELYFGCHNEKKLKKYFRYIEELYSSIEKNGYLPNKRVENFQTDFKKNNPFTKKNDEIDIAIGRNGKLLFVDGRHRLSIAKALNIEKVATTVFLRHTKWVQLKKELTYFAKQQGGKLYQPAYHFDLQDIPYSYGEERFNIIQKNLSLKNGSLLDIGANLGFFSYKFEQLGFKCLAVEINPQEVYFMKSLKKANNCDFEIIEDSVLNISEEELNFDIVLALNIFHHFLKRKSKYIKLKKLLSRLRCKEMFLGTHNPEEKQMNGAYKNFNAIEFVNFIIKNSILNNYLLVEEFEDGRKLFKIYS